MDKPSRTRMSTEERREQLLSAGVELLQRRPHDEVSTEDIAAAAGVSNGLLYHYFPTKKDFIVAAIERGQRLLAERLRPDPDLPPEQQLDASLDAFLDYVEEHSTAYASIFTGNVGDPEIAKALAAGRAEQMDTLMRSIADWGDAPFDTRPTPMLKTAVQGWQFFVEGAVLRWLEQQDVERDQLLLLLKAVLGGALLMAGGMGSQAGESAPAERT
jgi:AcrR family transcriptional regulator